MSKPVNPDLIAFMMEKATHKHTKNVLSALCSGFERRGMLPQGRMPLAEEALEAVAQVFERLERAERILAALREPSEGVLRTVFIATFGDNPVHKEACLVATQNAIRAAVAAAEQEVGRE